MYVGTMLIKRNLLIYFRNKSSVFFSLLSSIITLGLYLFFLNNTLLNSMQDSVADINSLKIFLNGLVICGVISLNAFTVPLSFMGILVHDKEKGALKDFFVSPVKKPVVIFSYVICSVIATVLINLVVVAFLIGYLYINDVFYMTFTQGVIVTIFYLFCNCLFATIAFFIANLVKTTSAFGSIIGLTSALIGFLSGVYMPIGNFDSKYIETTITLFPITQLSAVLKQNLLGEAMKKLFMGAPNDVKTFYDYYFGIVLSLFENDVTLMFSFVYLLVIFIIISLLSIKLARTS